MCAVRRNLRIAEAAQWRRENSRLSLSVLAWPHDRVIICPARKPINRSSQVPGIAGFFGVVLSHEIQWVMDMGSLRNHQIGLELDPETWSNLQSEVVARILALLPFSALVLTRLESRNWDRVVYSGRVLGSCVDSPQRSWLFLLGTASVHAFDPQRDEWQALDTVPRFVSKMAGLALCAAAGGLMVFAIRAVKSQFVRFGVFNPVTRSWKKLPPLLKRRQKPVVSMFMNGGSYRIVVAGGMEYDERVLSTEVYDSKSECWRVTCETFLKNQVASHVCEEMRTSTVFCDGILHHMRFNRRLSFDPQRENHTFMAYETKGARWRPLRVALPPDLVFTEYPSLKLVWQGHVHVADVLPPVLVESNKRLLLIGYREEDSSVCGAGIWEYVSGKSRTWRMMSVMPDALFQQVLCPVAVPESLYLQYSLQAAAHGELVYVFRPSGGVLLCDLAQCPPKWRCIRQSASGEDWTQGCAMDLRLDDLL